MCPPQDPISIQHLVIWSTTAIKLWSLLISYSSSSSLTGPCSTSVYCLNVHIWSCSTFIAIWLLLHLRRGICWACPLFCSGIIHGFFPLLLSWYVSCEFVYCPVGLVLQVVATTYKRAPPHPIKRVSTPLPSPLKPHVPANSAEWHMLMALCLTIYLYSASVERYHN